MTNRFLPASKRGDFPILFGSSYTLMPRCESFRVACILAYHPGALGSLVMMVLRKPHFASLPQSDSILGSDLSPPAPLLRADALARDKMVPKGGQLLLLLSHPILHLFVSSKVRQEVRSKWDRPDKILEKPHASLSRYGAIQTRGPKIRPDSPNPRFAHLGTRGDEEKAQQTMYNHFIALQVVWLPPGRLEVP